MNTYFIKFKAWYDQRPTREKILLLLLSWALLYAIFYFLFLMPLEERATQLKADILEINNRINSWKLQIDAINKISSSPLYKKWLLQRKRLSTLQKQYKNLMNAQSTNQWQSVIRTLLNSQTNISLIQLKDFPEVLSNTNDTIANLTKIYEQKFSLSINGNYFDTISYLERLEKSLPNIHWTGLDYQVVQYPVAKIDMEFSIFYEKAN